MFGTAKSGANAYAKIGVETGVTAANPHKLIVMLFDGAITALAGALQHMQTGNVAEKGQAISKAISIIDGGLRASLDKNAGGSIAQNLDSLYEYMGNRLVLANLENKPAILEEVLGLLRDLKSAWDAIGETGNIAAAPAPTPAPQIKTPAYDALAPRISGFAKA